MTQPTPPDPFTCPVCDSCDHDIRGSVLEFIANMRENVTAAGDKLLDAIETEGAATDKFGEAMIQAMVVKRQVNALIEFVPEVALIKEVRSS